MSIINNKIIGCFEKINNYNSEKTKPRLLDLVEFAINYFEYNYPNGYFIMVEGAHIDKMCHDNDINEMIKYLDEFNNAIDLAYEKLKQQDHLSILVTADHETGDLNFSDDFNRINNDLYSKSGHSSKNVKYFIYSKVKGIDKIDKKIDNTDIFKICYSLLKK